jgi:pentatricopeptide repeat protein
MKRANVPRVTRTYEALISCAEKCGKWEEAINLLAEMKEEGIRRSTEVYNSAMWAADRYIFDFRINI